MQTTNIGQHIKLSLEKIVIFHTTTTRSAGKHYSMPEYSQPSSVSSSSSSPFPPSPSLLHLLFHCICSEFLSSYPELVSFIRDGYHTNTHHFARRPLEELEHVVVVWKIFGRLSSVTHRTKISQLGGRFTVVRLRIGKSGSRWEWMEGSTKCEESSGFAQLAAHSIARQTLASKIVCLPTLVKSLTLSLLFVMVSKGQMIVY